MTLPRLDANGACALGHSILAVTDGVKLNPACAEAVEEVSSTLTILEHANGESTLDARLANKPDAKNAAHRLDVTWGCLYDFTSVWVRLDIAILTAIAQLVIEVVFPDGTGFLSLAYRQKWIQSRIRLIAIEEKKIDKSIHTLGGTKILEAVQAAHQEFGDILGLTTAVTPDAQSITLRDAMTSFMDAVRDYVVQVTAMQRKTKPETIELSNKLLHPVVITESRAKGPSTTTEDSEPTEDGIGDKGGVTTTEPAPSNAPAPEPPPAASTAKPPSS